MFLPENSGKYSKIRRCFKTVLLFLVSPIVPVFLETHYLKCSEEARKLAQEYNIKAIQKKQECRKIKRQLISFHRIELGTQSQTIKHNQGFELYSFYVRPLSVCVKTFNLYWLFKVWRCMSKWLYRSWFSCSPGQTHPQQEASLLSLTKISWGLIHTHF